MRNFILFIRRFSNLILFLIVESVCIVMMARTDTIQGDSIMSSANIFLGSVYQKQNDVAYYFALRRMNDSLLKENARLQHQIMSHKSIDTLHDWIQTHEVKPEDTTTQIVRFARYEYKTARVINNSIGKADNYITINRGENDGIRRNMAVVSGNGVAGRVVHVSKHFASIRSVLSTKMQVSAKLKNNTFGYVTWGGKNPNELVMKDIPQQIQVNIGDSIYTTSYSFFPPDVLIGTVARKEIIKKNNLQLLYLKPVTNFSTIQYVYVVGNELLDEKKNLEDTVKHLR